MKQKGGLAKVCGGGARRNARSRLNALARYIRLYLISNIFYSYTPYLTHSSNTAEPARGWPYSIAPRIPPGQAMGNGQWSIGSGPRAVDIEQ